MIYDKFTSIGARRPQPKPLEAVQLTPPAEGLRMKATGCEEGPIATDGLSIYSRFPAGAGPTLRRAGKRFEYLRKKVPLSW